MKKTTKKIAVKVGAGVAIAGAAAALGYYFYGSKNAKTHRKIAAKWATEMKGKVVKEVKLVKKASPKIFAALVDKVAKGYQSIDKAELKKAAAELKANWKMIQSEMGGKKPAKKVAKKR
jgi:hypothetical protein